MTLRLRSIRWRLQIWYGLLLAAALLVAGFTAHGLASRRIWADVDDQLRMTTDLLGRGLNHLRLPPDEARLTRQSPRPLPASALEREPMIRLTDAVSDGTYYVVWTWTNLVWFRSENAPAIGITPVLVDLGKGPVLRQRGSFREYTVRTRLPAGPDVLILVGRPVTSELSAIRVMGWRFLLIGAAVQAAGLACGAWIVSVALRPIQIISVTARRIATGDLSQRIPLAETDSELGALGEILNDSFGKLEALVARQRQFTADAAHELRTPVSVIRAQCQAALAHERSAPEYREALAACGRASHRMRRLVESLLDLARLDAGDASMQREILDLARAVRDCVELLAHPASDRGVHVEAELNPVSVCGDATRLEQVATNLLGNAIDHSPPNGRIQVAVVQAGDTAEFIVEDEGPGIRPEDLPRVFDRFHRTSDSRSDGAIHAGLGLAITKAIVEAHGGSITVANKEGTGARFRVLLPVAQAPTRDLEVTTNDAQRE